MFSCLTEHGRVGLTAVAGSAEEAWHLYTDAEAVLLQQADRALEEEPVVG
jgi:hypothetical protein